MRRRWCRYNVSSPLALALALAPHTDRTENKGRWIEDTVAMAHRRRRRISVGYGMCHQNIFVAKPRFGSFFLYCSCCFVFRGCGAYRFCGRAPIRRGAVGFLRACRLPNCIRLRRNRDAKRRRAARASCGKVKCGRRRRERKKSALLKRRSEGRERLCVVRAHLREKDEDHVHTGYGRVSGLALVEVSKESKGARACRAENSSKRYKRAGYEEWREIENVAADRGAGRCYPFLYCLGQVNGGRMYVCVQERAKT